MKKIIFLCIFLLTSILLIYLYKVFASKSLCSKCNVVIIDIDHLRADALSCMGYDRKVTPNICKFAEKGILFEKNYSHSCWTLPGIASTITSLYPSAHKVHYRYINSIPEEIITLPEVYRNSGYLTAFIGPKEGDVGYLPSGFERGIDKRESLSEKDWIKVVEKLKEAHKPFYSFFFTGELHIPYVLENGSKLFNGEDLLPNFPNTQQDIDRMISEYILEHYEEIFSEEIIKKHPEIFTKVTPEIYPNVLELYDSFEHPSKEVKSPWMLEYTVFMEYLDKNIKDDPNLTEYIRKLYDTKLFNIDKEIGNFIDYLNEEGMLKNTIIVLMSDHGEEFMEHGGFAHYRTLYNEILHTPLIVYMPGIKPKMIKEVTENIDIYPTLLEINGMSTEGTIQGRSLYEFIYNNKENLHRYAIAEIGEETYAIQDERWKLIVENFFSIDPVFQLYDLSSDPNEKTNVTNTFSNITQKMFIVLKEKIEVSRDLYRASLLDFPDWIDEETRKKIIDKGYF